MIFNPNTKLLLLWGDPVSHSLSPKIHNYSLSLLNNNNFCYLAWKVSKSQLNLAIDSFKNFNILGSSITVPLKEDIIEYLDYKDDSIKKIKACNTIIKVNKDEIFGYNTDYLGIINSLTAYDLSNKTISILGSGGATRAACYAFNKLNTKVSVFCRNTIKAETLTKDFKIDNIYSFNEISKISESDLIFNATPVGMKGFSQESLVNKKLLNKNMIVFDSIYNPKQTILLKEAQSLGAITINGLPMLIHQAAAQFKLFTSFDMDYDKVSSFVKSDC